MRAELNEKYRDIGFKEVMTCPGGGRPSETECDSGSVGYVD